MRASMLGFINSRDNFASEFGL